MKEIFAKIIELDDYQVLITKDYEPDEVNIETEEYFVIQSTMKNGIEYTLALSYLEPYTRDEIFNTYSEGDAKAFIEQLQPCIINNAGIEEQ